VARLFDRSQWDDRQRLFTIIGKLFSAACLVLIVFTPLKVGSTVFVVGTVVCVLGLAGLVSAMIDFARTPLDQAVTRGLYKVSRHPQIVSLFVVFVGICLAIGSWLALTVLVLSKVFQHLGIVAEEAACLAQYGEPYRAYLERVPRYFLFF
jgi:protein-S-isoprenylcysteine O-methyltransferase Ste14